MTPRNPLPRAAITAVCDAQAAQDAAAAAIRAALRALPRDAAGRPDLTQAIEELLRGRRLLDDALAAAKNGGRMEDPPRLPAIGRHVTYYAAAPGSPLPMAYAAVVAAVDAPSDPASPLGLWVFAPYALRYVDHVPRGRAPDCWDWPER